MLHGSSTTWFQTSRFCRAKVEFNSINLVRHGSSTTLETGLIRIQYDKNWETLLAYLLRTKVSCSKAAEIAATRLLKAQSFFVCYATYKAFLKKISPIEITTSWQIHWQASSLTWIAGIGIVIRYKHNLIHTFIQSLNPISKILKFKRLQIRHKPRNQLTTKAQSFPRKSFNTASPMTARHARDFKWNWGCSSNFLPLTHGYQIPHPVEDSDNQISSSPGRQRCQMPGVFRGGCWSFDLTDT